MALPSNEAIPPSESADTPSVLVEVTDYEAFLAQLQAAEQTPLSPRLQAAAECHALELRRRGLLG